ncbi:TetR family transcriptional regulator [Streptomyces sp. SCUT-3]|uniref:TetR/AcrR family transcriptional regulator n=1 Tax=Streptomyces sp. SCUT-3 TaxID=2684469 RepID=UPI000CAEE917|nr:TetR family transcriptional regulator [Streptomyces sp. SCUT-3]PLW73226.1 TetR family transcriptional regulator [Streptomyces sp. DJ]QMV23699.1 TetR family transcriptional regulator [Streptomyces sp. SCUT-3]
MDLPCRTAAPRESLRERRRRETRDELHAAALRLSRELGFEQVTVEMISEEAGVSPRTFFNYFPSKESALLIWSASFTPEARARFLAAPARDTRSVLEDVGELFASYLEASPPRRDEVEEVFRIAERTPSVLAAVLAGFDALERELWALVAERTGRGTGDRTADLVAGISMAAVRVAMRRWAQDHGCEQAAPEFVRESFALLKDLTSPLEEAATASS